MTIYRGLNVGKALSDIDDSREALKNLGLNRADFDIISGLTDADVGVGISDFHNMANLSSDQKKELEALAQCADNTERVFLTINDVSTPLKFNYRANDNKFVGGAIKYGYAKFDAPLLSNGDYDIVGADISTSRLSSWSPVGSPNPDDYILYGGDIKVRGDRLSFTSLTTTEEPIAKTFRAEVPTHILQADISDSGTESLYLMKGIPLTWEGVFETISLDGAVERPLSDIEGTIPITWRITNLQSPPGSYNSGDGSNNTASIGTGSLYSPAVYTISPPGYMRRRIEFFYDPSRVVRLGIRGANLNKWTNVSLPSLRWLDLSFNDFAVMPEFRNDGVASKQGFSGGAGLAPNLQRLYITGNNLGRANDYLFGTDRENTGNSSQQCNRLPTSLQYLIANGCFTDSATIDMEDHENLLYIDVGANYTRELQRAQTASISPKTFNPKHRRFFSVEDSNYTTNASSDTMYVAGHGFSTGDAVKYDYHVDSTKTMGEPISTITLTVGQEVGNSSATYYVRYVSGNTIQLYTSESAANSGGSSGRVSLAGTGGVGHGRLHSLLKWDTSSNSAYMSSTSKGIVHYRIYNQSYTRLSPGAYNSRRLYLLYNYSTPCTTNSETPNWTDTASINGTITGSAAAVKASKDMAIPKFEGTVQFRYHYSRWNNHNLVDFSGNTSIYRYYDWQNTIDSRYQENERSLAGKFGGCTSLSHLLLYDKRGLTGDIETDNLVQNLPNLRYYNSISWGGNRGITGRMTDNVFSGSDKLNDFTCGGTNFNQYTSDLMGTSGEGGDQGVNRGRALSNANENFRYFRVGGNLYGGGALVQEEAGTYDFIFPQNDRLITLYLYRNNFRGTMPNVFNSFSRMVYCNIARQKDWMRSYKGNEKQIYRIGGTYLTTNSGNVDRMMTNDWKAIGWVANQNEEVNRTITGEFANASGGTPASGDAFKLRHIPIATGNPSNYLRIRDYRIMKLGDTDWNAISNSGTSPYLGQIIRLSTTTITAQIQGTVPGKVTPYSKYTSLRSRGFSGAFPTFNNPMNNLYYLYIYMNSFSGQCPKIDAPRLLNFRAYSNNFSGKIPDFSSCTIVRELNMRNNELSGYTAGSLANSIYLSVADFRNNQLQEHVLRDILIDLIDNYTARNRSGVTINLKGQGSGSRRLRESSKFDGTSGENSTKAKLDYLKQVAGWSILLDS